MITEGPYALSLNAIESLTCPLAMGGNPPTSIQLQNASPFVLNVMSNGQVYTIQAFTAQTVPCSGSGESVTVTPTGGPAGTNGSLTAVWLLANEQPPMADGQLTGAAQYAQGLGSILLGPVAPVPAGQTVNIPPTVRTLVIEYTNGASLAALQVVGQTSGLAYYTNGGTYLAGSGVSQPTAIAVVPVNGILDPVVELFATVTGGTVTVVGDTAQYDESLFYNGVPVVSSRGTTGTIVTGPCRVLSINLESGAGAAALSMAGQPLLRADANFEQASVAFAGGVILGANLTVAVSGTIAIASVVHAYP